MNRKIRACIRLGVNITYYLCLALTAVACLKIFFFASFHIPTESMYPAIYPGDWVLVNKLIPGARLFNLAAALRGEKTAIYRLPGLRSLRRGDVAVFHYPYPHSRDTIDMHLLKYYVKRVAGLPGDTLAIHRGRYHINGAPVPLPAAGAATTPAAPGTHGDTPGTHGADPLRIFPHTAATSWTLRDFGPVFIPRRGSTVALDSATFPLYRRLIEWEQDAPLALCDSAISLGGRPVTSYTFLRDYCFMAGDRADNSLDSRYWGFLPEEYIVGKAWFIWKSVDPHTGRLRPSRLLKGV
jgi:signal peptidase I